MAATGENLVDALMGGDGSPRPPREGRPTGRGAYRALFSGLEYDAHGRRKKRNQGKRIVGEGGGRMG